MFLLSIFVSVLIMKREKILNSNGKTNLICGLSLCLSLLIAIPTFANDLNDGISTYRDEPIRADDQIGDPEVNYSFIEMRAKSRISSIVVNNVVTPGEPAPPGTLTSSSGSMGNINSVVLLPGSNLVGDIVIIDNSYSDKTLTVIGDKSYSSGLGLDYEIGEAASSVGDSLSAP